MTFKRQGMTVKYKRHVITYVDGPDLTDATLPGEFYGRRKGAVVGWKYDPVKYAPYIYGPAAIVQSVIDSLDLAPAYIRERGIPWYDFHLIIQMSENRNAYVKGGSLTIDPDRGKATMHLFPAMKSVNQMLWITAHECVHLMQWAYDPAYMRTAIGTPEDAMYECMAHELASHIVPDLTEWWHTNEEAVIYRPIYEDLLPMATEVRNRWGVDPAW